MSLRRISRTEWEALHAPEPEESESTDTEVESETEPTGPSPRQWRQLTYEYSPSEMSEDNPEVSDATNADVLLDGAHP